jgi:hypothetical protein
LYLQQVNMDTLLSFSTTYNSILIFIDFLKANSVMLSGIILIYGIINRFIAKADISKLKLSRFLINSSIIMFLVLQLLPVIVNIIL